MTELFFGPHLWPKPNLSLSSQNIFFSTFAGNPKKLRYDFPQEESGQRRNLFFESLFAGEKTPAPFYSGVRVLQFYVSRPINTT
jgi:hypothetical protein